MTKYRLPLDKKFVWTANRTSDKFRWDQYKYRQKTKRKENNKLLRVFKVRLLSLFYLILLPLVVVVVFVVAAVAVLRCIRFLPYAEALHASMKAKGKLKTASSTVAAAAAAAAGGRLARKWKILSKYLVKILQATRTTAAWLGKRCLSHKPNEDWGEHGDAPNGGTWWPAEKPND